MSSFDSTVLFSFTAEQVTRCFDELYGSFRLCKWVPESELIIYRDEYLVLRDHLRLTFPMYVKTPCGVLNVVELLTRLPALRARPRLLYVFELSCLCLTETGTTPPDVKFGDIDTSDCRCSFIDVIHPVQSYLLSAHGCCHP